jgi:lysophospholipase L1-like esterase
MGWAPTLTSDGVHPTAEGARLMSQAAATTLRWRHADGM